jgi:superfamily I DNA/RNA helicase
MTLPFISADQDARCRIRDSLDENLLVEAGAGTDKTTSLVERIAQLIVRGPHYIRPGGRHHLY